MPPATFPPDDPATQQALKRIALSFLRDDSAAEDVVQEVWLASLEHAPADYESSSAWLVAVTKNIARSEVRRRRIHHDTEARYAVPEVSDASTQRLERRSLRQALVGAIDELDGPTADTIRAKYLEGRTAVEIAEETAETPSTVRSRLKRGLERIRTRLEPEFGGSVGFSVALIHGFDWTQAEWASALDPGPVAKTVETVSSESTAVVAGKAGLPAMAWFAVAALAAMTISVVMWVTRSSAPGGDKPAAPDVARAAGVDQNSSTNAPAPEGSARHAQDSQPAAESSPRSALSSPPSAISGDEEAVAPTSNVSDAPMDSGVMLLFTTDENEQRIGGAKIFVHRDGTSEQRAVSDQDGVARVPWSKADLQPITSPHKWWYDHPALAVTAALDGRTTSQQLFIDPRLLPKDSGASYKLGSRPIEVRGRVVGPAGNGVAGARLTFAGPTWTLTPHDEVSVALPHPPDLLTDEEGRFHVKGVNRKMTSIISRVEGVGAGRVQLPETPEEVIDVTLELRPASSLRGRVSTVEGDGVEGVAVSVHARADSIAPVFTAETGEDGTYSIEHIPAGEFLVTFIGDKMSQRAFVKFFPDQAHRRDVVAGARPQLVVQTVDENGLSVPFVMIAAVAPGSHWKMVTLTNENGKVTIPSTPIPGEPGTDGRVIQRVEVHAFIQEVNAFPVASRVLLEVPDEPLTLSVPTRLNQLASLSVVITDHGQRVPENVSVILTDAAGTALRCRVDPATGAVVKDRIPPGPMHLMLQSPWSERFYLRRVDLRPGANDLGRIELPELGKIEVDWRWTENDDAALYTIRAVTRYGSRVRRPVLTSGVAGGGSHDVLPGEYAVFAKNAAGKTLMVLVFWVDPGQTKRIQLGPAAPRTAMIRMKWNGMDDATCSMTTRTVPFPQLGMESTAEERKAARDAATPSEPRTVSRDPTGYFAFGIEMQDPCYVFIELVDSQGKTTGTMVGVAEFDSGSYNHDCVVD